MSTRHLASYCQVLQGCVWPIHQSLLSNRCCYYDQPLLRDQRNPSRPLKAVTAFHMDMTIISWDTQRKEFCIIYVTNKCFLSFNIQLQTADGGVGAKVFAPSSFPPSYVIFLKIFSILSQNTQKHRSASVMLQTRPQRVLHSAPCFYVLEK